MTPKLSHEVEQFVAATPHGATQVEGVDGGTYWVLTEEAMRVRQYVLDGITEADRGDIADWNSDDIKSAGRDLKKHRSA